MVKSKFFSSLLLLIWSGILAAQTLTTVSGTVKDARTGEALPYVNIYFENTTIGVSSDMEGNYELVTEDATQSIVASYVGYKQATYPIALGKAQRVDIRLAEDAVQMEEAIVTAKKQRYSKKNNPAVDLMREVIERKDANGISGKDYCSYDKYEKIQVDLNNIGVDFRQRKIFNKLEFVWDYLDSTGTDSKPFLPMLLRETASKVYTQRNPSIEREYVTGSQATKLDVTVDQSNLNEVINALYQNVDIYENDITLLQKQFVGPLSPLAISFYRFYIVDTVMLDGQQATHLEFIPKNQATYGFTGDLYISTDSLYQVLAVQMGLFGEVNLNFVRTINIEQDFKKVGASYLLARGKVIMDFALSEGSMGFTGAKTVYHDAYDFEAPADLSVFSVMDRTIVSDDAEFKSPAYWADKRQVPLDKHEAGIYNLVDTIAVSPKFKQIQRISSTLLTGYITVGKVDLGPYTSFFGFNEVEGFKPKFGGKTNLNFSKNVFLQGYVAYGFDDERFKYAAFATYSFNKDYLRNPRHYVKIGYVEDTRFPGYEQGPVSANNAGSSFRWGVRDKMFFSNTLRIDYVKETKSMEYGLYMLNDQIRPYGTLRFDFGDVDNRQSLASINTTEIGGSIRLAPNQQYTQRGDVRNRIYNQYPIFDVSYGYGLDDMLGGDFSYHKVDVRAFKRFNLSILGSTHVDVRAGKIFGEVPFVLMHIPKANQTYIYRDQEYSVMNFMEFVGDEYVSLNVEHFFEGFFFNRIPLVKKAKLREVFTFKALVGGVESDNNPNTDANLIQYPVDGAGETITTALSSKPYMEAGIGITNIAKVLRVDLVQRLTYLDRPDLREFLGRNGLALRVGMEIGF